MLKGEGEGKLRGGRSRGGGRRARESIRLCRRKRGRGGEGRLGRRRRSVYRKEDRVLVLLLRSG